MATRFQAFSTTVIHRMPIGTSEGRQVRKGSLALAENSWFSTPGRAPVAAVNGSVANKLSDHIRRHVRD